MSMKIELTMKGRDGDELWSAEVEGGPQAIPPEGRAAQVMGAGVVVTVKRGDVELGDLEWRRQIVQFAGGTSFVQTAEEISGRHGNPSWTTPTRLALLALSQRVRVAATLARELARLGEEKLLERMSVRDDVLSFHAGEIIATQPIADVITALRALPEGTAHDAVLHAILLPRG